MRAGTVPLIIILVASILGAGLLAGRLHQHQAKIAETRGEVSRVPLAGFHKFAADVEWMRFIQFCGAAGGVNDENVDEFKARIDQIIGLDPDFKRIYYEGALMLAAQHPHYALEILDRGMANPRLADDWRLPLTAGSTVIRPQLDKIYRDEEADMGEVKRARDYFAKAARIGGRPEYALNALIRAEALLRPGDDPREIKELEAWYEQWKQAYYGMMSYEVGDGGGAFDNPEFYGMGGGSADHSEQVMRTLRYATEAHPNHPRLKALSKEVLDTVFKSKHIDPHSLMPYQPGDRFSAHSGKPVEVYGVCKNCGVGKDGRHVVLKGVFCHVCGKSAAKEWAEMQSSQQMPALPPVQE